MALPLAAAAIPLIGNILDRVIPDKAEAERVKNEIMMQSASIDAEIEKARLELAKEDAKTGKGGYRWGAGWLCVLSLGYAWIINPFLVWLLAIANPDILPPPSIPVEMQYTMLTGMLGLAGVRSYDLMKGSRQ